MHAPNAQRELVGSMIRYYREQHDLELSDAADILGCDRSKMSRIESGERGIRSTELRKLLSEYDVDTAAQDMLVALSGWHGTDGWWHAYQRSLPSAYLAHIIPETFASQSLVYAPSQVPDLLRTPEYDKAITAADPSIPSNREDITLQAASARRKVMLHEHRARLVVVIGEAALRQQIGGTDVLKEQLTRLAELGSIDYPWITIRVLPFGAGAHAAGGAGGFSLLQFNNIPELAIAHLDGPSGGLCLHERAVAETYVEIFWQLYRGAMGSTESGRKIIDTASR